MPKPDDIIILSKEDGKMQDQLRLFGTGDETVIDRVADTCSSRTIEKLEKAASGKKLKSGIKPETGVDDKKPKKETEVLAIFPKVGERWMPEEHSRKP